MNKRRFIIIVLAVFISLLIFMVINVLVAKYNGKSVAAPQIPRQPQTFGQGEKLKYVVMGDSTSIGQGTDYQDSYAYQSAQHLAKSHQVTLMNLGISGATAKDVNGKQLQKAKSLKPDVVLIAVGSNDARRFVSAKNIKLPMQDIINGLYDANCNTRIVITGSAAMDSVDRFPWAIKKIMGLRTDSVNKTFTALAKDNGLTIAPIARQTRDAFLADPTLFAQDKFHPNARGYALWTPVINKALDKSLQGQWTQACRDQMLMP